MTAIAAGMAVRTPWPATIWRVAVVAVAAGLARFAASVVMAGAAGTGTRFDMPGELVASTVVGVTLVALAALVDGTPAQRGAALSLVAFASVAAVQIEGAAFAPALSPVRELPLGLVLQLGVSAIVAGTAVRVVPRPDAAPASPTPAAFTYGRAIATGAIAYVMAYLISGALMYLAITGPYYEAHEGGLQTPPTEIVLVVAVLEGLLMALASAPLVRALPGSTRARGAVGGLALWALGGLVPLLQVARLPDVIRAASAVEILFQKVPVGIVIARRLRR